MSAMKKMKHAAKDFSLSSGLHHLWTLGDGKWSGTDEAAQSAVTWAMVYNFIASILYIGRNVVRICALSSLFPHTRKDVFTLYTGIMSYDPTVFYFFEISVEILFAFDMINSWRILFSNATHKEKAFAIRHSNFANMGLFLSGYFICSIIGDMLLWFDFSPYYFFGLTTGSLVFLLMISQWSTMRFVVKMALSVFGGTAEDRNHIRTERKSRDSILFIMYPLEWLLWSASIDLLQAHTLIMTFSSLFASAKFFNQQLGTLEPETLYMILMWLIVFLGSLGAVILPRKSGLYANALALIFVFIAVQQSGLTNTDPDAPVPYPKAWISTTVMASVLLLIGVICNLVSISEHNNALNWHLEKANEAEKQAAEAYIEYRMNSWNFCYPFYKKHGAKYAH